MTKEEDPYSSNWSFPGSGTLGNVAGAIGSFITTKESNPNAPRNPSTLPSSSSGGGAASTRPAAVPASTSSSSSWNPLTSSAGPSGMMQAAASPGSIIQRSIQQSLTNRATKRTGQTGALFTGGPSTAGARASTPSAAPRILSTSSDLQTGVNRRATYQTPAQKAADPLGWANIARDLGNAGDARFAKFKTGGPGSTAAQKLVGTQQRAAKAEVTRGRAQQSASRATKAAKSKKGGKNAPKAV